MRKMMIWAFDHRFDYDFDEIDKYDEFEEDPAMPLEDENNYKYYNKEEEDDVFESPLVDEQEEAEDLKKLLLMVRKTSAWRLALQNESPSPSSFYKGSLAHYWKLE